MAISGEQVLPVVRVGELPSEELAERWLVEQLWCAHAVGVIGGAPKCAKTWLGLDMALSVATGTPCLGRYAVPVATERAMSSPSHVLAHLGAPPITPTERAPQSPSTSQRWELSSPLISPTRTTGSA